MLFYNWFCCIFYYLFIDNKNDINQFKRIVYSILRRILKSSNALFWHLITVTIAFFNVLMFILLNQMINQMIVQTKLKFYRNFEKMKPILAVLLFAFVMVSSVNLQPHFETCIYPGSGGNILIFVFNKNPLILEYFKVM